MGISGLLPSLKEIQVHGSISEFKGKRLAVDAYVWLHKGAFGCAEELVKGKKTTKFVDYAMYRIRLLRHHGTEPYVVFDGGPLPAKKKTESSREKSRADNLARARSLESQGRLRDARDAYTKCVDITPEMAFQLIKALRAENVDYVVAPYEADAQLCFLEQEGYVDGIITEDSDLLVFGCKQVIFKLEGNGRCVWIQSDKLAMCRDMPMHGWTTVDFRRMAMLSGCDYLDSIPGVGLKTAHRLLRRHKTVEKVVQMIRLEGTLNVPTGYIQSFAQAELAFIHQRVFDPATQKLIPLNDFPEGGLSEEDEKWVGLDLDVEVARGVARGDLHPETRLPIEDMCPDYQPQSRANGQKVAVAPIKTKVAGPMDAFISRGRIAKPLPVPVGKLGPGVSRLSDRNLNLSLDSTPRASAIKKSKFFGSKAAPVEEAVQLVWHSSDPPSPIHNGGPSRSRSPSPSPVPSAVTVSPCKAADQEESFNHLTSPLAPAMSSPAMSTPPHAETLTSPRHAPSTRSRSATPLSPTQPTRRTGPSILIPSTSQPHPSLSQTPKHTPNSSSPILHAAKLGTSTYSNYTSGSDGLEEIVTPSLPDHHRPRPRSRESGAKRQRSDENITPEDEERATKAKVIAKDWRLKYAFGGVNTPTVRPRQKLADADATPVTLARARSPMPLSATIPRILASKPINIPDTPAQAGPTAKSKTAPTPILHKGRSEETVELVQASSSPMSDGAARLSRYMFTGKVDTRQHSSPSL